MKKTGLFINVLVCVSLLFGLVLLTNSHRPALAVQLEFSIRWIRQLLGTLLASLATLILLLRVLNNEPMSRLTPLLVALFAALLLISVDWTIAIPLGLVIVGYIVKETVILLRGPTELGD